MFADAIPNMILSTQAQRVVCGKELLYPIVCNSLAQPSSRVVSGGKKKWQAQSQKQQPMRSNITDWSNLRICDFPVVHISRHCKSALIWKGCTKHDPRAHKTRGAFQPLGFWGFASVACRSFPESTGSKANSTSHEEGSGVRVGDEACIDNSGNNELEGEVLVDNESNWDIKTITKAALKSGLYLVGTPIGNLEDITIRAIRVLKSANLVLAEDTRHSAKLLRHYGIRTPSMSYHKFNEFARRDEILRRLQQGEVIALISDAGMPAISDPGNELVMACVGANVHVSPIPGPSALLTALVASGLPTDTFSFVGFLPAQSNSRQKRLITAAKDPATQIFFVPPHKLPKVLDDFISSFGSSRRCAVAREMTKLHEEFWRGTLGEAKLEFEVRHPRGELTLVVEGLPERLGADLPSEDELKSRLQVLMDAGMSPSDASKQVVEQTSARRNKVYPLALEISRLS